MVPSSASLQLQSTGKASVAGTFTNWANAPSTAEAIQIFSNESHPEMRMQGRTNAREPIKFWSPPGETATTRPQQSVPCMNGNGVTSFQPPSPFSFASCFSFSPVVRSSVLVATVEEYQPRRVFISVLLTPAASTFKRISFEASSGIGTSRYSSFS